ncbi:high-potential iron-sulfur protein [Hydrogenophaga sp.]|uniref:high-potential iron-sulfur protein n=1 Tax=Hydrogenophaga sp. TaxID=1904254 RepID=UPI003D0E4E8F
MNDLNRRVFLLSPVAAGSALLLGADAARAQVVMVSEKDATAAALGYTTDSARVNPKRFPNHSSAQKCGNCELYAGRPGDGTGECRIFTGKRVSAIGWCSAYVLKG